MKMSLRIIYGRAGSGKTHFCLNDIKEKLAQGGNHPLVLVVPEQFTLQAERNLVRVTGTGGIIRAEVLSFRRMAYRVFNEVGGVTRRHVNPAGKSMLIFRIIDGLKDELDIFSRAASQQGFINVLSETIAEFKRYNITPDMLDGVCKNLEDGSLLKNKLAEINVIYRKFEEDLHEKYLDSDDDLTVLTEKLDQSVQFDGSEIWIDGFSGFTPQEYGVIGKLLKKATRINVCMCTDCVIEGYVFDGTEVFSPVKNAVSRLLRIARENGVAVEKPVELAGEPLYRFRDSKELMHLERQFFSSPYRTYRGKTEDISIFAASNIYSEVENTARDIIRLCRDTGMRYRDIAVVTRDLAGYEKLISSIFTQYGIPHFIDRKKEINSHPLIQLILSALEIFISNWSYEAVFRYLKTGLTGIEREDIDILENYVLACGIRGSMWTREGEWNFSMVPNFEGREMSHYEKATLERINDARNRVTGPLMALRSKTRGRKKARDICTAIYEFLCDMDIPERIEERIEAFKNSGQLDLANEYGQVWNIVMEVFDQIVEVMGDESTNIEKFRKILSIGFQEYKVGLIPPALDQVLVGSIERSKNHEIRALYILGVNDGVFPSVSNDEGVLRDRERENLRSMGIELAQDTRTRAFEEHYLTYSVLTTAGKYLRLSYPIADHNGATMRPSIIVSRLKRIFPDIKECTDIIRGGTGEDKLEPVTTPQPTFNELISAIRRRQEGLEVDPLWLDVHRWYMQNESWKEKYRYMLQGLKYTNQVAPINTEKARKLYGSPVYTSVSRLERYASCPFSYYIQYGLKAKERKIFELTPPDVGTFMHNVIDRFSRRLAERDISWRTLEREQCAAEVSEIVDEILDEMSGSILNSSRRYRYLTEKLKRVLVRAVWLIAEHIKRSGFEPIGYEVAFGEGGKFPPMTIELPSGDKVYLTGRIDRVDVMKTEDGTYLRVIDYKSGAKDFKLSDVYYGLQIQLISYLDALWENGSHELGEEILPGGILYFRIDDPIIRDGNGLSEGEIEKSIMKQLRMKGLLLADVKLVRDMDRNIDGDSLIIPARINKDNVLSRSRSSAATGEQFQLLRRYVRKLLSQTAEEMLKGNVAIRPYKKNKFISCKYCSYSSICQFDSRLEDNNYRILKDVKDDEVWKLLEGDGKREKGRD
jgi:ATP-dependent helicase/nuclease subunit B